MQKVNFILKLILLFLKNKAKDKGLYVRERNSGYIILICILFMVPLFAYPQIDMDISISGKFEIGLETTVTLEQLHHPLSSYAVLVFDLQKHLYEAIDGFNKSEKVDVNGLSLTDLSLSAPNIPTSAPLTAVVKLGYRENSTDVTVPLIWTAPISLPQLKEGPYFTQSIDFDEFSNKINNRDFVSHVFFVIQIIFSGEGNLADYGLGSIDANLRLEAKIDADITK
jgi:hypothetical protein